LWAKFKIKKRVICAIKTISALYEFKGEVRLEVSANGQIVN